MKQNKNEPTDGIEDVKIERWKDKDVKHGAKVSFKFDALLLTIWKWLRRKP